MNNKMKDTFFMDAFMQAYGKEHPLQGLIIHTDQGSQFTESNFRMLISSHGAIESNSRKGTPYDNAKTESFYRAYKKRVYSRCKFCLS